MKARIYLAILLLMALEQPLAWAQSGSSRAQQAFAQAQQLATAGRFNEALDLYREANRHSPANAAPILGIGVCLSELGPRNHEEALEMLDSYLDVGRNPESRQQAQQIIGSLLGQLGYGTLNITVSPAEATVSVDGEEVPAHRRDRVRVNAGNVTVEARASRSERARQQVFVTAGAVQQVTLSLSRASATTAAVDFSSPSPPATTTVATRRGVHQRWWFWTIIGTVVVGSGLAVGLTFGLKGDEPPASAAEWNLIQ